VGKDVRGQYVELGSDDTCLGAVPALDGKRGVQIDVIHSNARRKIRPLTLRVVTLLVIIPLISLAVVLAFGPDSTQANSGQYHVLSDYLARGLTDESHRLGGYDGTVVIKRETTGGLRQSLLLIKTFFYTRQDLQLRSVNVLVNLITSNLRPEQFQRSFVLPTHYELMTESESKLYPYDGFQKRFPGNYGYHTFTKVGFNRGLTEAVFYTEHICGLCGEGKYVYMRKQGGKWFVERVAMRWVS
jgi:hypothetical protein